MDGASRLVWRTAIALGRSTDYADYIAQPGRKHSTQRRKGYKDAKKKSTLNFAPLHSLRLCVKALAQKLFMENLNKSFDQVNVLRPCGVVKSTGEKLIKKGCVVNTAELVAGSLVEMLSGGVFLIHKKAQRAGVS